MNTVSERFHYFLDQQKLTQKKFAELTEMTTTDANRIALGTYNKKGVSIGLRERIERAIKEKKLPALSLEWLNYGRGPMITQDGHAPQPIQGEFDRGKIALGAYYSIISRSDIEPAKAATKSLEYADAFLQAIMV